MSITSHAQNFEDVILWRALRDVVGGFYVDVGAQDPVVDSVSLAFYENGWRGVHVEPVAEYAERLRNARPDEQVIEAIVDVRTGWRVFYEFPGTGLSTGSRKIAERHAKSGLEIRKVSVPCLPLSTILDGHGKRDIHWLKIDVEGMERQVIQSWGDASARPWVILVESTQPLFKTPTFAQWEPLLLERGYEFVYFDGLNRFYVSNEHRELKEAFGPGPNVFDDFVLSGTASTSFCARLNEEIRAAQHRLGESEANAARLAQVAEELRNGAAAERASFVGAAAAWENASAALTGELAAKGNALAASEARIATLEARIGGLDEQREQLDGLVRERDRHIAVLDGQMTELDREVARLNRVLSERDRHIAAADAQMMEINQEVGRLKSELSATSGALAERDREIALIESQSAQLLNEAALLKAELSAQADALAARDRAAAMLSSRVVELDAATASLLERLDEASTELTGLRAQKEETYSELVKNKHEHQTAAASWAREKADLSNALDSLRRAMADAAVREQAAMSQQAALRYTIERMRGSTSWRITAPLRFVRYSTRRLTKGAWAWLTLHPAGRPRRVARRARAKIVDLLTRRPKLAASANRLARQFRQDATNAWPLASAQPPPLDQSDSAIAALLAVAPKYYVFVDHTVACPVNTGVQRVARGLARGLVANGACVRYVKWDASANACVLIDREERLALARWNGPEPTIDERDIYPERLSAPVPVEPHAGDRLIVPEVTHITNHPEPITLDLIFWARRRRIRTGFIFYDAIPLRRDEFAELAPIHSKYMQDLRLADVIWPISRWSGDDLVAYWAQHERAGRATMPDVHPLHLPADFPQYCRNTALADEERLILSVGTIEPRKNQLTLIYAFKEYLATNPDSSWRLVLAGNLHPLVAEQVRALTNDSIQYVGNISDDDLFSLYQKCAFTVFPSIEEGFGLPIIESLWFGKPCVCADFGAMKEIAAGRGCLTVDTRDVRALKEAIAALADGPALRHSLAGEAIARSLGSWEDYASTLSRSITGETLQQRVRPIYYWIESTRSFPNNTGIQRVTRQLARELINLGQQLVPVKWGGPDRPFVPATEEDLVHLARFNGPDPAKWAAWTVPSDFPRRGWFFMAELPLNLSIEDQRRLRKFAAESGLSTAAIFFDAIPWKMRSVYSDHYANAHHAYILELGSYDFVAPISKYSSTDLVTILAEALERPQSLNHIIPVDLADEFPETERITEWTGESGSDVINILSVGTVEPRKNHETLLKAFAIAEKRLPGRVSLTIVGRADVLDRDYLQRVEAAVAANSSVRWIMDADDSLLNEAYRQADFTVYPSLEEGFGLPIVESLWHGKPCICAHFGAMAERALGGGCLTVDVSDTKELASAIVKLASDASVREQLGRAAVGRPIKTWRAYAHEIVAWLAEMTSERTRAGSAAGEAPELLDASLVRRAQEMRLGSRPRLSLCITTYNRGDWLETNLKNWARLYPEPIEGVNIFVCDNASTDHTARVVEPYFSRPDFSYRRNQVNVGMLGNLRETANAAPGQYIWIIGDDDILMPGSIERVLRAIDCNPQAELIYLNYAFTTINDAKTVTDFDAFYRDAKPIVPSENDIIGPIRTISARNENIFTAIYTLVFRRDHAINAYSQNTDGRPFSSMLTCIPTTYYVLHRMMETHGVWIGAPQVVVNMNVSWMRYAALWILERIPEAYEVAEKKGADRIEIDRWRRHTWPGVVHYFREIFKEENSDNAAYFCAARLVRRFKHLPEFRVQQDALVAVYQDAWRAGHPAAKAAPDVVFPNSKSAQLQPH